MVKNGLGAAVNVAYQMPAVAYMAGMQRLMSGKIDFGSIYNSDLIQNRIQGGHAPEMRDAITTALFSKPSLRGDLLLAGMQIHGRADAFGTAIGAAISYDYHLRNNLALGYSQAEAEALALDVTADAVSRTSQPTEVIDRSLMELNLGTLGKLAFLFGSEARQKSSMWLTAWGNTLTGEPTIRDIRVLFMSHFVMAPLMFAASAVIRDATSGDDDELFDDQHWDLKDFALAVLTGPFAGVPLLRDLGSMLKGFGGSSSPIGGMVKGGMSLYDIFEGEPTGDESEWYEKKILQVLQGLGFATPAVASNIYKQVSGAIENLTE